MTEEETPIPRPSFFRRVKTPTVIQMESVECGAAALAIILGYYGKYVTLEELRVACGVSRNGVSALDILKAAEKYNLSCEGHKLELEDLYDMPLPLVAFWGFDHFIVIEGFSHDCVYINDPAYGPLRISYEELDDNFTGLALVFEPMEGFQKSGAPPGIAKILLEQLKDFQIPLMFAIIAGFALLIPALALPAFTQIFIDNILVRGLTTWGTILITSMVFVIFLSLAFDYLQKTVLSRLMIKMSIDFSSRFLTHILYLPINFYRQRYTGEVANRLNLNDNVAQVITHKLTSLIIESITATVFAVVMFYYDPLIAAFGVVMTLANLFLMRYLYRTWSDSYAYYQKSIGKSIAYSISSLQSIETIKTISMENQIFGRWAGYYTKTINSYQNLSKTEVIAGVLPAFLQNLTLILVVILGAWRVINGHLTIGMLMALKILMENFMSPIVSLVSSLQSIQLLLVDFNRIDDVLKNPLDENLLQEETNDKLVKDEDKRSKLNGYLKVENLTFGFGKITQDELKNINLKLAEAILVDISLQVDPGMAVAILGTSGSGKSTLLKVIAGLYYPWKGDVLFDGISRSKLPRSALVNSIGYVQQEYFLFAGTILENLTCFDPIVNPDDLIQAAKDACIHDEIVSRQGGYDMMLENDGLNLSGGQRQQLEIARALIKKPTILILDEATSFIDSDTEMEIFKNIRRRGCACLIVTHRLSTIRSCNMIYVIQKGVLAQKGTHEELNKVPGLYRDLNEIGKLEIEE